MSSYGNALSPRTFYTVKVRSRSPKGLEPTMASLVGGVGGVAGTVVGGILISRVGGTASSGPGLGAKVACTDGVGAGKSSTSGVGAGVGAPIGTLVAAPVLGLGAS